MRGPDFKQSMLTEDDSGMNPANLLGLALGTAPDSTLGVEQSAVAVMEQILAPVWPSNFGNQLAMSSDYEDANVPAPTCVALLLIALMVRILPRRFRPRVSRAAIA